MPVRQLDKGSVTEIGDERSEEKFRYRDVSSIKINRVKKFQIVWQCSGG